MSAPTCHRTLAPATFRPGCNETWDWYQPMAQPCIGSACAMWVHEVETPKGNQPAGRGVRGEGSSDALRVSNAYSNMEWCGAAPSGRGWCADNLRAVPWPDPALPAPSVKS